MRRAIIHNPENSFCRSIRFLTHHLANEPLKWSYPTFAFATAKDFRPFYIPGSQIGPCPFSFIFVLNTHGLLRFRPLRTILAFSSLNTGFFISRYNIIPRAKWLIIPEPFIKTQYPCGFFRKGRVPGENPAAVTPGPNGIFAQPPPQGHATYLSYNSPAGHFFVQLSY